ncbi:MAG: hypothetical protein WCF40_01740, partial [Desulfobacterales bacterium]
TARKEVEHTVTFSINPPFILSPSDSSNHNRSHPRNIVDGKIECPIYKCGFFPLGKAAQRFAVRRT